MEFMRVALIVLGALGLMGFMFFSIAVICSNKSRKLRVLCRTATCGTIVDFKRENLHVGMTFAGDPNRFTYFPIYEYVVEGKRYRRVSFVGVKDIGLLNKTVTVLYSKTDPGKSYVKELSADSIIGLFRWIGNIFMMLSVSSALLICITQLTHNA